MIACFRLYELLTIYCTNSSFSCQILLVSTNTMKINIIPFAFAPEIIDEAIQKWYGYFSYIACLDIMPIYSV